MISKIEKRIERLKIYAQQDNTGSVDQKRFKDFTDELIEILLEMQYQIHQKELEN